MTYYEILGVEKTATEDEIKKAYRAKAFEFHPDRNPSKEAEETFKQVSEAYQVLSNPERRRAYDITGTSAFSPDDREFNMRDMEQEMYEFLSQMSGKQGMPPPGFQGFFHQRGAQSSVAGTIKVGLEGILNGTTVETEVNFKAPCSVCLGARVDSTKKVDVCGMCNGSTHIRQTMGNMLISTTCPACRGSGKGYPLCETCHGSGDRVVNKKVKVKVPIGVQNGNQLQVPIEGTVVTLLIQHDLPNDTKIDGHGNVYRNVDVSYPTLALGGTHSQELISGGTAAIKIPPGTPVGQGLRLRGAGVPQSVRNHTRGDYIVVVGLKVPSELSDRERELLTELKAVETN